MEEYLYIGRSAGVVFIFVAIVIGVIRFRTLSCALRYVFYFTVLGGATEILSDLYKVYISSKNTMPISHVYRTFSVLLLCFFYLRVLKGYIHKRYLWGAISLFAIFSILNPIFFQSIHEYPNILGAVGGMLLIVFSILYFARIMTEAKIEKLHNHPEVRVNIAILVYYTGNFFFYVLYNLNLSYSDEFARLTLYFYIVMNILFYATIGSAFYLSRKK